MTAARFQLAAQGTPTPHGQHHAIQNGIGRGHL